MFAISANNIEHQMSKLSLLLKSKKEMFMLPVYIVTYRMA